MTKSNVFTAVYRDITPDECGEITRHPKWSAGSWSHALDDRNEGEERLLAATAHIALLGASLRKSEDEAEGLRKDAERYRWIRDHTSREECEGYFSLPMPCAWDYKPGSQPNEEFESLDAAIDAAIAAKEGT